MSERIVKGFKVFNPDWTCNPNEKPFQYKVGGIYEEDVKPMVCSRGFHFCKKAADCFNYYQFDPKNKVAEVIALGEVDTDGVKSCTNKIHIVREIPWQELLEIVNTGRGCAGFRNSGNYNSGNNNSGYWNSGNDNSGDCNSGDHNSGTRNSGYGNSGDCNSGNWNSGDWNIGYYNSGKYNSGDHNSGNDNFGDHNSGDHNIGNLNSGDWNKANCSNGCFNTVEPKIYLFNKPSEWSYHDWLNSDACRLLEKIPSHMLLYVRFDKMTDEEKAEHPEAKTTGGYLKLLDTSECAVAWWRGLCARDKDIIKAIPNFDKAIFKDITGIDVDKD